MKKVLIGLLFGLLISACATIHRPLINRTLAIHQSGKLYYRYCQKKILGICTKYKEDWYDLNIPETAKMLDGFICKNREL